MNSTVSSADGRGEDVVVDVPVPVGEVSAAMSEGEGELDG